MQNKLGENLANKNFFEEWNIVYFDVINMEVASARPGK